MIYGRRCTSASCAPAPRSWTSSRRALPRGDREHGRLEYEGETGALNEFLFGHLRRPDLELEGAGGIDAWNWRLGDGVSDDYPEGMRDFKDPAGSRGGRGARLSKAIRSTGTTTGASTTRRTRAACTTTAASIITPLPGDDGEGAGRRLPVHAAGARGDVLCCAQQHLSRQATLARAGAPSCWPPLCSASSRRPSSRSASARSSTLLGSRDRGAVAMQSEIMLFDEPRPRSTPDDHFERMPIQTAWLFFVLPSLSIIVSVRVRSSF